MKKIILVVLGCFVLTLFGVASLNAETILFSINGYAKTCSDLGDEEYCNYCKCQTGKGSQGIPNYQCDDGSKPVCANTLDDLKELDTHKKTQFEKACVTLPDSDGEVGQSCKLCRCITGQPVNLKMPGSFYQCSDNSVPECVDEDKK